MNAAGKISPAPVVSSARTLKPGERKNRRPSQAIAPRPPSVAVVKQHLNCEWILGSDFNKFRSPVRRPGKSFEVIGKSTYLSNALTPRYKLSKSATTGMFSWRAHRAARVEAAVSWPSTKSARQPFNDWRRKSGGVIAIRGTLFQRTVRSPDRASTKMKEDWLEQSAVFIQSAWTPSRAISLIWNFPAASSPIF